MSNESRDAPGGTIRQCSILRTISPQMASPSSRISRSTVSVIVPCRLFSAAAIARSTSPASSGADGSSDGRERDALGVRVVAQGRDFGIRTGRAEVADAGDGSH